MKQLILIICLLGCMAESQFTPNEDNTDTKTTSENKQGECSKETCTVEMAEGERLLSALSRNQREFLETEAAKSEVVLKLSTTWATRIDYVESMIKPPLKWWARRGKLERNDINLTLGNSGGFAKYASGTGNNDHLPATTKKIRTNASGTKIEYYPAGKLIESAIGFYEAAAMTYDVIDYFANPQCPATITGRDAKSQNSSFVATFPNGNEIRVAPLTNRKHRSLLLWMGKDDNLKIAYAGDARLDREATTRYFATYTDCGVKMPEHDYSCVIGSTCPSAE